MSEDIYSDPGEEKESQCEECGEYLGDCECEKPTEELKGYYSPQFGKDRR